MFRFYQHGRNYNFYGIPTLNVRAPHYEHAIGTRRQVKKRKIVAESSRFGWFRLHTIVSSVLISKRGQVSFLKKKSKVKLQFMALKRVANLNCCHSPTVGRKYKSRYLLESTSLNPKLIVTIQLVQVLRTKIGQFRIRSVVEKQLQHNRR